MEDKDWDHQFQRIVENLDMSDTTDPRDGIQLWDINRAVLGLTEAAMYLSRFIGQYLQHDDMEFPENLETTVRQLISLSDRLSDELADCDCPECAPDCGHCEDGGVCNDCAREFEIEDEEDD